MKSKKILIISLPILFVLVVVFAVFMMFTVEKVNVDYTVFSGASKTQTIQDKFDTFLGKNLLTLNLGEVESVDVGSRYEIESVKKTFPNLIEVKVIERKEAFLVEYNGTKYVVSDKGYVLDEYDGVNDKLVPIKLNGITLYQPVVGEMISSDHNEDLYNAIKLARLDCVVDASKEVTVEYVGKTLRSVIFLTHTDVKIRISMPLENGEAKAEAVFDAYVNEERDYIKSYNEIRVDDLADGKYRITWVKQ